MRLSTTDSGIRSNIREKTSRGYTKRSQLLNFSSIKTCWQKLCFVGNETRDESIITFQLQTKEGSKRPGAPTKQSTPLPAPPQSSMPPARTTALNAVSDTTTWS